MCGIAGCFSGDRFAAFRVRAMLGAQAHRGPDGAGLATLTPKGRWHASHAARPRDLKLMAFHPLGSARMDARPSHGVLDENGRVHGTKGVYVCDGSAVPSSLGVNPQITIMTLATRLAHHLCRS